jgi:segregation and condensation protein A
MEYIDLMQDLSLELAAEYLVMAAILAEIKSRMLLPKMVDAENNEEDPRAELVRRLQEYERYKQAAENLDKLPRIERDTFAVENDSSQIAVDKPLPNVTMRELVLALADIMKRAEHNTHHRIQMEALSVREKMTLVLSSVQSKDRIEFTSLFDLKEGRLGVVVTFLAMLELLKQGLIEFVQAASFAPIYLAAKGNAAKIELTDEALSFT